MQDLFDCIFARIKYYFFFYNSVGKIDLILVLIAISLTTDYTKHSYVY